VVLTGRADELKAGAEQSGILETAEIMRVLVSGRKAAVVHLVKRSR
jgi:hypothetical protein